MTAPLLSVIVLSYNRRDEMRECLHSVYAQNYRPFEVVVLDNGSADGSVRMLKEEFPSVKLIELAENVGSSAGRDLALEEARGEFIIQIDNDATISPPGAFARMIERFLAEDDLGIIFSKIEDPLSGRAYRPGYGNAWVDDEFYTWRFHGCIAMIRRETIRRAGYYLPAEFFRTGEENDLAVRTLDAAFNILYCPSVLAHHKLSAKARDKSEIVFLNVRNNIRVAWKFYPLTRAALLTLWRIPHYVFARLLVGDTQAIARVFAIVGGLRAAFQRRKPISADTLRLIDTLTLRPAMDVEAMRSLRAAPGRVGLRRLVAKRLKDFLR